MSRYSLKNKNSPSTTNKTPGTIKTTMSALDLAYNRVHGVLPDVSLQNHGRPQNYGDLTWLRLDRLMEQSKVATIRPLFEGSAHPEATAPKLQEPVWVGTAQRTGLGSWNAKAGVFK